MRILLTIVLLMAVAAPASGLDRKPRKKEKKKARTEAVADPAPAPAPPAAKPAHTERKTEPAAPAPAPLPDNDMTLGLTAAQADSLVAVWRERQCCDSFREFFDNYILVDSTQTGAVPDSVYTRRLRDLASSSPTTASSGATSTVTPTPATARSAGFWACRSTISR